ncbi:MAG TPA: patatin-like phospholipase family protein, partial [Deinococcales bacterium]|nr:patatin-like phospholipase family protein [Deinococcales bacterium]
MSAFPQAGTGGPRLVLALGGGAVRGVAHLGVLRALEEAGLRPDAIAGTSSGAIVGLLYALERAGLAGRVQPLDVLEMLGARHYEGLNTLLAARNDRSLARRLNALASFPQVAVSGWGQPSLASMEPVRRGLLALAGVDLRFEDLALPLAFVATDVQRGERVVL